MDNSELRSGPVLVRPAKVPNARQPWGQLHSSYVGDDGDPGPFMIQFHRHSEDGLLVHEAPALGTRWDPAEYPYDGFTVRLSGVYFALLTLSFHPGTANLFHSCGVSHNADDPMDYDHDQTEKPVPVDEGWDYHGQLTAQRIIVCEKDDLLQGWFWSMAATVSFFLAQMCVFRLGPVPPD